MAVEFWTNARGVERTAVARARLLESDGWTGMGWVDSECLAPDPYVSLTAAALSTTKLRVATAVTNSATRHPAVAACLAASLQQQSDGRFLLGIGRGDSALAHLGLAPAPLRQFERYLERLRGYLAGEEVDFDLETDAVSGLKSSATLGMAGGPTTSRLRWVRGRRVCIDVAASGPKVIAIAARRADAITFALGVDRDRLTWAIDLGRSECTAVGRDPETLGFGTYVPMLVDDDRSAARRLISGGVGSYARFSVMHGKVAAPIAASQQGSLEQVHQAYDMNAHFGHGSPQSEQLTDEVIDSFAIAGPASYCRDRVHELISLGLTRLFILGPGGGLPEEDFRRWYRRISDDVLPHFA